MCEFHICREPAYAFSKELAPRSVTRFCTCGTTDSHDPGLTRKYDRASIHTWYVAIRIAVPWPRVYRSAIYRSSSTRCQHASTVMAQIWRRFYLNTSSRTCEHFSSRPFFSSVSYFVVAHQFFYIERIYMRLLGQTIFSYDRYVYQTNLSRSCYKVNSTGT